MISLEQVLMALITLAKAKKNFFPSLKLEIAINSLREAPAQKVLFPFDFNVHRDSQFKRLSKIQYLSTLLISSSGIDGGHMQLFHSENDQLGPFSLIHELDREPGSGYIVDERPQIVFHGMKKAISVQDKAHRTALLCRFFK